MRNFLLLLLLFTGIAGSLLGSLRPDGCANQAEQAAHLHHDHESDSAGHGADCVSHIQCAHGLGFFRSEAAVLGRERPFAREFAPYSFAIDSPSLEGPFQPPRRA